MDKIDSLIKRLAELNEELKKNMNASYSSTPQNMAKDAPDANASSVVRPDAGYGKVTVTGAKPMDPKKPGAYGKVMVKEELTCSENGQWKVMEKSVYNAGTHPMKGRQSPAAVSGHEFEPDHSADYDTNFKEAHAHYKKMGMSLNDDKIHNILKRKLKKK